MSASQTPPAAPTVTFSTANIMASPATTLLGIGYLFQNVAGQLGGGLPTNTAGWIGLAVNTLIGLAGVFGKA